MNEPQPSRFRRLKALWIKGSAAFQLPVSFGYDWDALHDVLSGNDWTDAEDAIILISNAHLLLADETEEEQSTLCDVLESDDSTLNKEAGQTLKIFLHTTTEDYEKLENLLGNLSHASSDPA